MEIHIKESTIVPPAKETPKHCLRNSELDLFMATYHVPIVYFYQRPNDDCSKLFDAGVIKETLSNALVPFYPIAGRLGWDANGRLEIDCNAEGVLFVVAETCSVIDDLGDFTPSLQLQQLVPAVDYTKDITSHPLLLLQVTYFKCGGACLGVGFHHTLADGTSVLHFINTWADMARGFPMKTPPLIDRTILRARVPSSPSFHHIEYDPPLFLNNSTQIKELQSGPEPTTVATLKLSPDQINTIKASLKNDLGTNISYRTNYEILAAHIWRCMCKARGLPSDQASKLYISMSGRSRLNPPIPSSYFGNVIFFATPIALSGDIQSEQLVFTVERIHKAIKRMDNEYLTSALAYLEQHHDITTLRHGAHTCKSPNVKLVSWVNLPLYDADFGWGRPVSVGLANIIIGGISFILPSPSGDGSLSLVTCLETHQMKLFKKFFYEFQLTLRGKI